MKPDKPVCCEVFAVFSLCGDDVSAIFSRLLAQNQGFSAFILAEQWSKTR